MKIHSLPGHADSLLPEHKKWQLVWHDEFDGDSLDRSKWMFRTHLLQCQHPTLLDNEEGLEFKDSCLHMKLVEKDGEFYSTQLQTGSNYMDHPGDEFYEVANAIKGPNYHWPIAKFKQATFMHRYGYYECRCKLQQHPGWWSAFWLQSPIIGCCPDPAAAGVEVDIMECFHPVPKYTLNNHWGGYGVDHDCEGTGPKLEDMIPLEETPDGFHIFGCEWSPNGYVFYADGKEVMRLNRAVSHIEEFIMLTTECKGYRASYHHDPELTHDCLPDAFIVDYVRVYDEVK